jgi:hypothetical protein
MIPKSFKLQAHTIKVKVDRKKVEAESKDCLGLAIYTTNEILLTDTMNGLPLDQTVIDHAFYHELCHHILGCMNERKLNNNEKFVDTFAGLLHQALSTFKYETRRKSSKSKTSES